MKKHLWLFSCLLFVILLSSCKSDDTSICFTENVEILQNVHGLNGKSYEEMVDSSDSVLIVKLSGYNKETSESKNRAFFSIQKIEILKEDEITNDEVKTLAQCKLDENGIYYLKHFYAIGSISGEIQIGEYYLIFVNSGSVDDQPYQSNINHIFQLEGYDESLPANEQSDEIIEIIDRFFEEY